MEQLGGGGDAQRRKNCWGGQTLWIRA